MAKQQDPASLPKLSERRYTVLVQIWPHIPEADAQLGITHYELLQRVGYGVSHLIYELSKHEHSPVRRRQRVTEDIWEFVRGPGKVLVGSMKTGWRELDLSREIKEGVSDGPAEHTARKMAGRGDDFLDYIDDEIQKIRLSLAAIDRHLSGLRSSRRL